MSERAIAVVPVKYEYVCDECGVGSMQVCGAGLTVGNEQKIPHQCPECGASKTLPVGYPMIRFEDTGA